MAIINRANLISNGFGTPISNDALFLKAGTSLSGTVEQTTSLSALTPAVRSGWIRIKLSAGGGTTPTLTALRVDLTDGTTTEWIFAYNPATAGSLAANNIITFMIPFLSELAVTQIDVKTTMGGTLPTATLDIDVTASN